MTTEYKGFWTWKAKSAEYWTDTRDGTTPQPIPDEVTREEFAKYIPDAMGEFVKYLLDNGAGYATVTDYTHFNYTETISIRDISKIKGEQHLVGTFRTITHLHIGFETDYPISESPIAPIMVGAIAKAIALIILACAGAVAIMALKGLYTTQKTVEWTKTTTLPDGTVITESATEDITEPSLWGIGATGLILALLAVVFLIFIVGMPKKK